MSRVPVRDYYRRDGIHVGAHTRSWPRPAHQSPLAGQAGQRPLYMYLIAIVWWSMKTLVWLLLLCPLLLWFFLLPPRSREYAYRFARYRGIAYTRFEEGWSVLAELHEVYCGTVPRRVRWWTYLLYIVSWIVGRLVLAVMWLFRLLWLLLKYVCSLPRRRHKVTGT